jgi:DNA end-binding protein Ku
MARPYWTGQVTISLVSFGVKLFVATEAKSDIKFHQIDRSTGERVRHQKVLASAVERNPDEAAEQSEVVERSQIVKGYEYSKGQYVTIEPEELAQLRVPSKHTMEVAQFVSEDEIDPEFFEKPYFVVPENDAQTEAFLTVRKALQDTKKIALTKIAFGGREHVVALAPAGNNGMSDSAEHGGMMAYTMRYAAELRKPAEYFSDIKHHSIDKESLDLAKELIKRRSAKFNPEKFVDGYEVAVKELVDAKLKHLPIPKDEEEHAPAKGKVINLMDALRKSVASKAAAEAPAKHTAAKKPAAQKKPISISSGTKKPPRSEKSATRATGKRKSA